MEDVILRFTIQVPGFLFAVVCHEAAHAWMALKFGDSTARDLGRLTLNPIAHCDMIGSVIFPLIGTFLGGVMFGWAKPVPVNVRRLRNQRSGIFWVSFAGPLANIILGIISAFFFAILLTQVPETFSLRGPFIEICKSSVLINFILAAFNLIPFPPLDGSKMVSSFLSYNALRYYEGLARFTPLFFIFLLFTDVLKYLLAPAYLAGSELMKVFYYAMS